MVAFSAFSATIFRSKSVLFGAAKTRENRTGNVAFLAISQSTDLYATPLQKSVLTNTDNMASTKYPFQYVADKIRETMASKSNDNDKLEELIMIDTIQRLGLKYHFREEIHATLERHYANFSTLREGSDDLHEIALCFRLLRQEGYKVTADSFEKFKNSSGNFKQELCKDIKGLLSLFEASQLSIPGDDILDEANEFSERCLKLIMNSTEQSKASVIASALGSPQQKSLPRLGAKNFLQSFEVSLKCLYDYNVSDSWANEIRDLATMDFNMAQAMSQSEIAQVFRWWKELRLTEELKLARDQPMKWYMWSLAALPNPMMGEERIELTKPISLIYIIDDIFDLYGTVAELTLFTEAINKWDYANVKGLPSYMKVCLKALYDTTNEMSHKINMKHGWNPKDSIRKAWTDLCNAFLLEAKWFSSGYLPKSEEYLRNGLVSSGLYVVAVHMFYILGQEINSCSISHLNSYPDVVSYTATILRLYDDLGSAKDENQDGKDGSFTDCYMNEHKGISKDTARHVVSQRISGAWKCLNKECMSPSPFPADFVAACLNLARMVPMMYSYDENHRLPSLERQMMSLLYESVNN